MVILLGPEYDSRRARITNTVLKKILVMPLGASQASIQELLTGVPDQLYQLPGQEVVTATRANSYGTKGQCLYQ